MFMFINPGKSLAPWVLALKQESYHSYIKKVIKKVLQTHITLLNLDYTIYTTLLDAIAGKNKSAAIKKKNCIRDIIDA